MCDGRILKSNVKWFDLHFILFYFFDLHFKKVILANVCTIKKRRKSGSQKTIREVEVRDDGGLDWDGRN